MVTHRMDVFLWTLGRIRAWTRVNVLTHVGSILLQKFCWVGVATQLEIVCETCGHYLRNEMFPNVSKKNISGISAHQQDPPYVVEWFFQRYRSIYMFIFSSRLHSTEYNLSQTLHRWVIKATKLKYFGYVKINLVSVLILFLLLFLIKWSVVFTIYLYKL